jgi:hypothetical protein
MTCHQFFQLSVGEKFGEIYFRKSLDDIVDDEWNGEQTDNFELKVQEETGHFLNE